ncbi:biotin/lipoate--protein ligase family protein [uncultured Roseobacter sp.]|uniref:biotin/lipoate--protein ligase family protein n=1 Tax=uncultured Roseobacter sp. TaxID=114847 RepID=UPI00262607B0|nr:biotin/lipoate--protein ligase family protein [uncultured Roseobacter sp.]
MSGPQFPPLFQALATAGADPMVVACAEARAGCDAGLVAYDITLDALRAAIIFAPEVPLHEAMIMLPICGIGFQNALGALAPPEVSVHLEWGGGIRVNGARCGALQVMAAPEDPNIEPDWLVVGLTLTLWSEGSEKGATPDETTLFDEGCSEVDATGLLEAWARHTLVWINRWGDEGVKPVHDEWTGLAHGIGESATISTQSGRFLGVDESFGMLLQGADETAMIPITQTLTPAT